MRTTLNLLFSPRKPKNYHSGDMPVYLRITVDGQRAEVAVSRKCDPNRWDIRMGRATGNKADAKALNGFLDGIHLDNRFMQIVRIFNMSIYLNIMNIYS